MTTQNSRFFDEIGRMMNGAAGAADGIRREVETLVRSQAERFVADMDLVKREDFDALREQVQLQDSVIKALRAEIDSLKAPKAP